MKHINDVWEFLDQFTTIETLEEAFGEIPNKFGSFEIINLETYLQDGIIEICNLYWDDPLGDYDEVYHSIKIK